METRIIINLACTIVGCIIGYLTFKRNEKTEIKKETKETVELKANLNMLVTNNIEIKGLLSSLDKKLNEFKDSVNVRLAKLEENMKFINKRIEEVEERVRKC